MRRNSMLDAAWLRTVGNWAYPTIIASLQKGETSIPVGSLSTTATITPVAMDRAVVLCCGTWSTTNPSWTLGTAYPRVELTNATTLTISAAFADSTNSALSWEVLELTPGIVKSIQRGVVSMNGTGNTFTTTINGVDLAKSLLIWNGQTLLWGTAFEALYALKAGVFLSNPTTVTAQRGAPNNSQNTPGFTVVEFY